MIDDRDRPSSPESRSAREPELAGSLPLLEVENLQVSYGTARAVFDVSFRIAEGSVLALLGANGAGKSTTARAISGLVRRDAGAIRFAGADVGKMEAHAIRRRGLAYLPEGRGIFPRLSVEDNLRMSVRWLDSGAERSAALARAYDYFPVLHARKKQRALSLSGGEQQMLSVAGGLCIGPRLLIADELSLGLAPKIVDMMIDVLARSQAAGVTILLIEQQVHRALEFADQCVILEKGRVGWSGNASTAKGEVLGRYLGGEVS